MIVCLKVCNQVRGGGGEVSRIKSCCKENDYYIKHIGYKYYSIEKCVKVEEKDVPAGFMAYKYTDELNDSLIGQKSKLPYGFCYNDIFLAVNSNVVEGESVFHRYECESGSKCSDNFNGLCIINGVSIDENKDFECANSDDKNNVDAVFIKYDNETIATCPAGTELKIKVDNGRFNQHLYQITYYQYVYLYSAKKIRFKRRNKYRIYSNNFLKISIYFFFIFKFYHFSISNTKSIN